MGIETLGKGDELRRSIAQESLTALTCRIAITLFISALAIAYTVGVVSGHIPKDQKIDSANLAILVLAALGALLMLQPGAFDRLQRLEVMGFKLEMLARAQEKQQDRLADISQMLPLLLPDTERKHLLNLADGKTKGYKGKHSLRTEIRRLRSMDLLRVRPGRHVREMADDSTFDLADYAELTDHGDWWVKRIREIEKAEAPGEG